MKHYLKPDGSVHAFEVDGSQDDLITPDMQYLSAEALAALRAPAPLTFEQQMAVFEGAIQASLDAFARTRNYDGIMSACTYVTSTVPAFAAEGQRCVELRDATWQAAYALLAEVQSGARPVPTLEEVLAEMPALAWLP